MERISIVIPCYNSEHSIAQVVDGICRVLEGSFDYQIILSNDCSTDGVWQVIQRLCAENKRIMEYLAGTVIDLLN